MYADGVYFNIITIYPQPDDDDDSINNRVWKLKALFNAKVFVILKLGFFGCIRNGFVCHIEQSVVWMKFRCLALVLFFKGFRYK